MIEDNDNLCSCGFDWSSDETQTPIVESEIPAYLRDLPNWDLNKAIDLSTMFNNITSVSGFKYEN